MKFLSDLTWGEGATYGPGAYSIFHIIWLVVCVGLCVVFGIIASKPHDKKKDDKIILIIDLILIATEIVKQLMYHVGYYGYLRVDVLPYSFCSVPMYIALVGALVKNEKVKEVCYSFLSFFGIVGGVTVMLYPTTLETYFIYTSFQTMLWHTALVVMGVYLIIARGYGKSFKRDILRPAVLFFALVIVAVGMNEGFYHLWLEKRQQPKTTVNEVPGSYEFYKFGTNNDSPLYLTENDGSLTLTGNPTDAKNVVITYPEGDNYDNYLLSFDTFEEPKYLIVKKTDEGYILTTEEAPTVHWNFATAGGRLVFTMECEGKALSPDFSLGEICTVETDGISDVSTVPDFVKVEILSEGDSANFFFISDHCKTPIPVLDKVQESVPHPIFVAVYFLSFIAVSSILWCIPALLRRKRK